MLSTCCWVTFQAKMKIISQNSDASILSGYPNSWEVNPLFPQLWNILVTPHGFLRPKKKKSFPVLRAIPGPLGFQGSLKLSSKLFTAPRPQCQNVMPFDTNLTVPQSSAWWHPNILEAEAVLKQGNPIYLPHSPKFKNRLLPRWQIVGGFLVTYNIYFFC